ncbi:hypothetical protein WME89_35605 [Sorangium sp. So ce321]|uniref:TolB family protein n=1 Tax=Sorangium sp. So ce321 TaxID=3133300 RepID=UPI003F613278
MRQSPLRRFEPDDLLSFKLVSEMILSHGGRWIVYVLEEIDPEADTYGSNLWLIPASGGAPRQITFGSDTNESPRFSPDSSHVAFLSDRGGRPGAAPRGPARRRRGEAADRPQVRRRSPGLVA